MPTPRALRGVPFWRRCWPCRQEAEGAPRPPRAIPGRALRRPGSFALIRHSPLAPGTNDPSGFRLDDCATQRNLSAEGRAQAVRIGELFRANGIAAADVHSSQWCRCLETATLMKLGETRQQPPAQFLLPGPHARNPPDRGRCGSGSSSSISRDRRCSSPIRSWSPLSARSFPAAGEIVVMQRATDRRLSVQGRLADRLTGQKQRRLLLDRRCSALPRAAEGCYERAAPPSADM